MNLDNPQELKQLISACIKGKRKYQEILHKALYSKLLFSCMRYTSSKSEAEDMLHDGFLKIFQKLDKYNYKGSFEGWARRIVVNNTIDSIRKKHDFTVDYEIVIEDVSDRDIETDSQLKREHLKAKIAMEAIRNLSPCYRAVFNMRVLDGMSHPEIAEKLGINVGTSKSNFLKAKRKLLQILKNKHPDLFKTN